MAAGLAMDRDPQAAVKSKNIMKQPKVSLPQRVLTPVVWGALYCYGRYDDWAHARRRMRKTREPTGILYPLASAITIVSISTIGAVFVASLLTKPAETTNFDSLCSELLIQDNDFRVQCNQLVNDLKQWTELNLQ